MIQRCTNPSNPSWPRYGGRGIAVCDAWLASFETFLADMGPRPSPDYSLDRRDNERGYGPANCRWATDGEQSLNTRRNRRITIGDETLFACEWSARLGVPQGTVSSRAARWERAARIH